MPFKTKPHRYDVWVAMNDRCRNPRHRHFQRYGGRGISVCARWRESYAHFISDMGPCPQGHTLERRDNDGDYSPDNCYWATRRTQSNNRAANRRITYRGETLTLAEWATRLGVSGSVLRFRLAKWSIEQALTTKRQPRSHPVEFHGETLSIAEWSRRLGLSEETIRARLSSGWTIDRALSTAPQQQNARHATASDLGG